MTRITHCLLYDIGTEEQKECEELVKEKQRKTEEKTKELNKRAAGANACGDGGGNEQLRPNPFMNAIFQPSKYNHGHVGKYQPG